MPATYELSSIKKLLKLNKAFAIVLLSLTAAKLKDRLTCLTIIQVT